jgi:hypothetical protein
VYKHKVSTRAVTLEAEILAVSDTTINLRNNETDRNFGSNGEAIM